MSASIDPREVYEYLEELGYVNISTKQLREFIKDLKILIKYDERKRQERQNKENICPKPRHKSDIFESLFQNGTEATKAKVVPPKKDKIITVQIKQHKDTCRHYKPKDEVSKEELAAEVNSTQVSLPSRNSDNTETTKECDKVVKIPSSRESKKSIQETQGLELKPKASFIRPKSSVRTTRSDPVALYHQYLAEWKKQKIPGEENYSNLRWVIREKMLGEQYSSTSTDTGKRKLPRNTHY